MSIPVLAIIQARLRSTRMAYKMLCRVGGETLIERGHRLAVEAFGRESVVVAVPSLNGIEAPLILELERIGATVYAPPQSVAEADVLCRFWHCAHSRRWNPASVISRITPDDPFKNPEMMRRVAAGERLPVELGGEAFTLAALDYANLQTARGLTPQWYPGSPYHSIEQQREHISYALFPTAPPPPPPGIWTVDCQADLDAVNAILAAQSPVYGNGAGEC